MFIHTGLLMEAKTPNEVIGVIAHETGHITGGHLAQMRREMKRATITQIATMLLGVAAMAGAAAGGSSMSDASPAGLAIMRGGSHIARRNFLAYRRIQESAADQAAVSFLNATGQSPEGMLSMFRKLANQLMVTLRYVDPYAISHPVPRERIALLERRVRASPYYGKKDSASLVLRHALMKAKLVGFTKSRGTVLRKYPRKDTSLPARYARAIAAYRSRGLAEAGRAINALIRSKPRYPYFYELKGQALLEGGRAAAAIAPLKKAVQLAPRQGLLRIMLAQAMLATNNAKLTDAAISHLRKSLATETRSGAAYRYLAEAYGRKHKIGLAEFYSAERFVREGNLSLAFVHAKRAKAKLRKGSPVWLRASDILQLKRKRKR
jgi:predicted Zn-dependent protease